MAEDIWVIPETDDEELAAHYRQLWAKAREAQIGSAAEREMLWEWYSGGEAASGAQTAMTLDIRCAPGTREGAASAPTQRSRGPGAPADLVHRPEPTDPRSRGRRIQADLYADRDYFLWRDDAGDLYWRHSTTGELIPAESIPDA